MKGFAALLLFISLFLMTGGKKESLVFRLLVKKSNVSFKNSLALGNSQYLCASYWVFKLCSARLYMFSLTPTISGWLLCVFLLFPSATNYDMW